MSISPSMNEDRLNAGADAARSRLLCAYLWLTTEAKGGVLPCRYRSKVNSKRLDRLNF